MRIYCNLVAGFLFLVVNNVCAQQTVADTLSKPLEEVIITAHRSPQQILKAPFSVQKTSRESLNTFMPRSTPEALVKLNGVFVQKTNHGGGSPFIRGLTGNQTLLLVDGIRLNNSTFRYGPNQYMNTIDVFSIQRIEVAKGTGSVQYGTDAIGGVIQVFTRSPEFSKDKNSTSAQITGKYMSGDMEKTIAAQGNYSGKSFAFLAGISKKDFGDLVGGDTTGKQTPSGYDEWSVDMKARWGISEKAQLTAAVQYLRQTHVPVFHKVRLENFSLNEMDPQQRFLGYLRYNLSGKRPLAKKIETTLSYQETIEGRASQKNGSMSRRYEKDKVRTVGLTLNIVSEISKLWTANSGIELYMDKIGSTREDKQMQTGQSVSSRGLYPDKSHYGNYSVYTLHHFQFGKWIADAGLRLNSFNIRVKDTALGNVRVSPSALVGNIGLLYQLTRQQSLYAAFNTGYRAPNIDDMGTLGIVDFRYEIPAAGLQAEKSYNTEVGYKLQTKKLSGTVAFYYMHLSDLITRQKLDGQVISGYPVYKKENTESAYIKGTEAEINWNITKRFNVNAGCSYTFGESLSKNEPLRRIPPFNGRITGLYKNSKWFAGTEWFFASRQKRLAQGDKDDNRIPAGGTPGWTVFNLFAGYQFKPLHINLGLQNILDEDYRMHGSGINGVGRSFWMSLTFNIN
jgi:hemoglobin/transferrin/lactoferrin receptor protein